VEVGPCIGAFRGMAYRAAAAISLRIVRCMHDARRAERASLSPATSGRRSCYGAGIVATAAGPFLGTLNRVQPTPGRETVALRLDRVATVPDKRIQVVELALPVLRAHPVTRWPPGDGL
jgi:hypothetical protein